MYTKAIFPNCFEKYEYNPTELTLMRYWKEEFDVLDAIRLIQTK